jgi:hypothetical protein
MEKGQRMSYANYLCLQRYSEKTTEAYLHAVADVASFHRQAADTLTNDQVQAYLLHCIREKMLRLTSRDILRCPIVFRA